MVLNIVPKFHKILIKNYSTYRKDIVGVTYCDLRMYVQTDRGNTNVPDIVMAGAYLSW